MNDKSENENPSSDLVDFIRFVEAEKTNRPEKEKAIAIWTKMIDTID